MKVGLFRIAFSPCCSHDAYVWLQHFIKDTQHVDIELLPSEHPRVMHAPNCKHYRA